MDNNIINFYDINNKNKVKGLINYISEIIESKQDVFEDDLNYIKLSLTELLKPLNYDEKIEMEQIEDNLDKGYSRKYKEYGTCLNIRKILETYDWR